MRSLKKLERAVVMEEVLKILKRDSGGSSNLIKQVMSSRKAIAAQMLITLTQAA